MTPSVQPATALYLHVPFCASSCDFCSFYQEQPKRGEIDRYLAAIERELELHPPGRVETAFWVAARLGSYQPKTCSGSVQQ
jgi:oxygen-independent coproporphyrinogen-3 oxidase